MSHPDANARNPARARHAYGWPGTPQCGGAHDPTPVKIAGTPTSGLHLYTVMKNNATSKLEARLDGSKNFDQYSWSFYQSCWGAVNDATWANEVYNFGDQSGGPNVNRQNWENVQYALASWTNQRGTTCNGGPTWPHQSCGWDSGTPKFWTWDTRF